EYFINETFERLWITSTHQEIEAESLPEVLGYVRKALNRIVLEICRRGARRPARKKREDATESKESAATNEGNGEGNWDPESREANESKDAGQLPSTGRSGQSGPVASARMTLADVENLPASDMGRELEEREDETELWQRLVSCTRDDR